MEKERTQCSQEEEFDEEDIPMGGMTLEHLFQEDPTSHNLPTHIATMDDEDEDDLYSNVQPTYSQALAGHMQKLVTQADEADDPPGLHSA